MNFDLVSILNSTSFGSFWFWTLLALSWSKTTHFTLGAGLHDIRDAKKKGGQDMEDVEQLIHINARKLTQVTDQFGVVLIAILTFLIATMVTLGFGFDFQLMQAMSLLVIGLTFALFLTLRFAHQVNQNNLLGEDLCKKFLRLRVSKQFVGITNIFVIAFYGAYYIISRGL